MFIHNQTYDWAIHIGEWNAPNFVSNIVQAKNKAAWIHTDIAESINFDETSFFSHTDSIDRYIFVSQNSMQSAINAYPFLEKKAQCIYNFFDEKNIIQKSKYPLEPQEQTYYDSLPVIVTCANIRPEKNHLRQLDAMAILEEKGIDFYWINIGAISDKNLTMTIQNKAKKLGLQDRFLLLGKKGNPYPYIKHANAVAVLSDYKSWSMVITESKILGVN